jgi:3-oxoacyl-[acyl-carrier protein] reductase
MPESGLRRFEGKVAVVTGAAWGMGESHASRFAEEGARVVLVDIQEELVRKVASGLPDALAVVADVTSEEQTLRMAAEVIEAFGGIDILVNNAGGGILPPSKFWDVSEENYDFLVSLNMKSQWLCAKAVSASMRERRGGRIINVSSTSAYLAKYDRIAYTAAKAGVLGQTRAMAHELGPFGVTVNTIMPGWINVQHTKTAVDPELIAQNEAWVMQSQAIKRFGTREDVSAAVCFFASADAEFLTGQILRLDGGELFAP